MRGSVHLFESCHSCGVDSFHCNRGGGTLVDRLEGVFHLTEAAFNACIIGQGNNSLWPFEGQAVYIAC